MRLAVLTAVTMMAFAANSLLNRLAVAGGFIEADHFALIRVVSGAVVLALLVRDSRLWRRPSLWGVLGLSAYLVGFSQAYIAMDAGLGALILFGGVQVTMFLGALLRKEVIPSNRWVGMLVAFAGLSFVVLVNFTGGGAQLAVLFMVAAAIGWGVYSLAGQGVRDPLAATARNFIWSVPLVGLTVLGSPLSSHPYGVALAVVSGALTSGLGYALWYAIIPTLGASRAAVSQLTVPMIAMIGGAVLLAEPLTMQLGFATLVVLGGVAFSLKR